MLPHGLQRPAGRPQDRSSSQATAAIVSKVWGVNGKPRCPGLGMGVTIYASQW